MATAPLNLPAEVWAFLSGPIEPTTLPRIFGSFSLATRSNVKTIHILFQSSGGMVGDGISLYNFLRTIPLDIVLYNSGSVASIATVAYLGAKKRKVSKHAAFMIHRTQTTTQSANTPTIQALAQSAVLFDKTMEAVLREHIKMPDKNWEHFYHNDLWLSAEDSVRFGLADEIADFAPPLGTTIYPI